MPTPEQINRLEKYLNEQPDDIWVAWKSGAWINERNEPIPPDLKGFACQLVYARRRYLKESDKQLKGSDKYLIDGYFNGFGLEINQVQKCFELNDTSDTRAEATERIMEYIRSL